MGVQAIDHVTYEVTSEELHSAGMTEFFRETLGMIEVDPSGDVLEKGWDVRWFGTYPKSLVIHLVAGRPFEAPILGLGHFCINVGVRRFKAIRNSGLWLEHDSGVEVGDPLCRLWLLGPSGLRVEVRP